MVWKILQFTISMKVKQLTKKQQKFIGRKNLQVKFYKALELFEKDYRHPSLHVELLEPKNLKFYSFRIDLKYRAVFIVVKDEVEIIAITNHYK